MELRLRTRAGNIVVPDVVFESTSKPYSSVESALSETSCSGLGRVSKSREYFPLL